MLPLLIADGDVIDLPALLSSIPGIAAATLILVALLRRVIADVPVAGKVPVWIYAVGVSLLLSVVAVVMRWMPPPEGEWREWVEFGLRVVTQAALASGLREWAKDWRVTPAKMHGIALAGVLCLSVGCGSTGQSLLTAHNAYQQANTSLATAIDLGVLDLDEAEAVLVVTEEVYRELEAATAAYLAGDKINANYALRRVQAGLDRLIAVYLRVEQARQQQGRSHDTSGTLGNTGDQRGPDGPARGPGESAAHRGAGGGAFGRGAGPICGLARQAARCGRAFAAAA